MKTRLTADERRDEVIRAAAIEFAAGGYAGTSTAVIARRAGVSQPYLFQLFGTKQDLFLAAVRDAFKRTGDRFEEIARVARGSTIDTQQVLELMGASYVRLLLADRSLLQLQLHAYAAAGDPDIRTVVRQEFFGLWRRVATLSGADAASLQTWFANGMLINVIASIADATTPEEFYATLVEGVATDR